MNAQKNKARRFVAWVLVFLLLVSSMVPAFARYPSEANALGSQLPVFGWHIFNNGPGGTQYPRANPGLAANGTIRMWAQLNGANAPVYLDATDTIVALDQSGNCAMEFVTVNQMWVAGTGWANYFNMVNVNKANGSWQYINLSITVYGETVHALLVNALFVPPVVPVFGWNIFNNGQGGTQYPRANPGLAASGTIRMWTQLDGVNAPVYLAAADTIAALDQNGQCAMGFLRVNRVWVAGTGWADYFNMVDVDKDGGSWQYINMYITVYGQTVHALLVNALFEPQEGDVTVTFVVQAGAVGVYAAATTTVAVPVGEAIPAESIPSTVARAGFYFAGWYPSDPTGFVVTEDITFTARFNPLFHYVTFEAGAGGELTPTSFGLVMNIRDGFAFWPDRVPTPVANDGYEFVEWYPANPAGFVVREDLTFTAVFARDTEPGPDPDAQLYRIFVDTANSRTNYNVGDLFDMSGTIVMAEYDDGTIRRTTGFVAEVLYTAAENTGRTAPYALGFYRAGPRDILITYTSKFAATPVTETYTLQVDVAGLRVYREYEFDLTGLHGYGSTWPANMVFSILETMYDGTPFNMEWLEAPGVIVTVEYEAANPAALNVGTGGDNWLHLRIGVVRGCPVTGAMNPNFRYRNDVQGLPPENVIGAGVLPQDRLLGSVDLRDRFHHANEGTALASPSHNMIQAVFEDANRRDTTRARFGHWHYLIVFSGGQAINANTRLTRVTIGMTEDVYAPWEAGWAAPQVDKIIITPDEPMVMLGQTLQFFAEVVGTDPSNPPMQFVTWSVINSTVSTINANGVLTVSPGENRSYITVRATSLADPNVYADFNIPTAVDVSDYLVPSYDPIQFETNGREQNIGAGIFNGATLWRSAIIDNSLYFHAGWVQPGTVLNLYYTGTDINNVQFGIQRRNTPNYSGPGHVGMGTWTPGGHGWATIPTSTDPALRNTHIIVDAANNLAQLTFEAFEYRLSASDAALLAAGNFHAISVQTVGASNLRLERLTLGTTNQTVGAAPWRTPLAFRANTQISDVVPAAPPLPTGYGISQQFAGDFDIGTHSSVLRWDDFANHNVGRITGVADLNPTAGEIASGNRLANNRWDSIRLQDAGGGAPGHSDIHVVAAGDTHLAAGAGRQSFGQPISGAAAPDMPGDGAAVLWTNVLPNSGFFALELQQYLNLHEAQRANDAGALFIRMYQYWTPNVSIHGSSHNGVSISAVDRHRITNGAYGTANLLIPDGYDWFNIIYEFLRQGQPLNVPYSVHGRPDMVNQTIRTPGEVAMYFYYPWMAGSTNNNNGAAQAINPNANQNNIGHVWGDLFFADGRRAGMSPTANFGAPWAADPTGIISPAPHRNPTRGGISPVEYGNWEPTDGYWPLAGVWQSIELMVQPNTVVDGVVQRDGRVAAWIDGEVVLDFPNMVIRYTEDLMMNISRTLLINNPNTAEAGRYLYRMVTHFVMATEYIGPMYGNRFDVRATGYVVAAEAAADVNLSDEALRTLAVLAYQEARAQVAALPANSVARPALSARLDAVWALIDAAMFATEAGAASRAVIDAYEAGDFNPIFVAFNAIPGAMLTDAAEQIRVMVDAVIAADSTLNAEAGTIVFVDPPTITGASVVQDVFEIRVQILGLTDDSVVYVNINVDVTFAAEPVTDASIARDAVLAHNFTAITVPWQALAANTLADALSLVEGQVAALNLTNVQNITALWGQTPTLPEVEGLSMRQHSVNVVITDGGGNQATAFLDLYIEFARRPLVVPVFRELDFAIPAGGHRLTQDINFRPNLALAPVPPQENWWPSGPVLTTMDGPGNPLFRRDMITHDTVITIYYELVDPTIPTNAEQWLRMNFFGRAFNDANASLMMGVGNAAANRNEVAVIDTVGRTMQITYEALVNHPTVRNELIFDQWQGMTIPGPSQWAAGSEARENIRITRVTMGVSVDETAPWENGFVSPVTVPAANSIEVRPYTGHSGLVIEEADGSFTIARGTTVQFYAYVNDVRQTTPVNRAVIGWNMINTCDMNRSGGISNINRTGSLFIRANEPRSTLSLRAGSTVDVGIFMDVTINVVNTLPTNAASVAANLLQAHTFTGVTVAWEPWEDDVAARRDEAIRLVREQVEAIVPSNVTVGAIAFVTPPNPSPTGSSASFAFTVALTGDDASTATANINVSVTFDAEPDAPLLVPIFHEVMFATHSGDSAWAGGNTFPRIMPVADNSRVFLSVYPHRRIGSRQPATLAGGLGQFRPEWIHPGTVLTVYFDTNETLTAAQLAYLTIAVNGGGAGNAENGGAGFNYVWMYTQIGPHAGNQNNRVMVDPVRGTIQVTYEALTSGGRVLDGGAFSSQGNTGTNNLGIPVGVPVTSVIADVIRSGGLSITVTARNNLNNVTGPNAGITITGISLAVTDQDMTPPWDPAFVPTAE